LLDYVARYKFMDACMYTYVCNLARRAARDSTVSEFSGTEAQAH